MTTPKHPVPISGVASMLADPLPPLPRPCFYCGKSGDRKPCPEGADRCKACLKRAPGLATVILRALRTDAGERFYVAGDLVK